MKTFKRFIIEALLNEGGTYTLNMATVPLKEARIYTEEQYSNAGKNMEEELPDFDKNYMAIQKAAAAAPDIPRIDMPVIEPDDIDIFAKDLKKGNVDIFKPYTFDSAHFPTDLIGGDKKSKEFLTLGQRDGNTKDDVVKAQSKKIPVGKLKPTQSQIWLEKVVGNILKFGVPTPGSPVTTSTLIVSKDGYILDGHHRYGQAMIVDQSLKMSSLFVPIEIKLLLKIGRSYGNAIGNKQKA